MPDVRKHERSNKSQLGQFFTPPSLVQRVLQNLPLKKDSLVLEPGCGDGAFIEALADCCDVWGIELDPDVFQQLQRKVGDRATLFCEDFLLKEFPKKFDFIVGNPPFGGTIDYEHQNQLERKYGCRYGCKIKKETYSYFLIKSLDLLKCGGEIRFICSDTLLTIKTMSGLRKWFMSQGEVEIERLDYFSEETSYPMLIFKFKKVNKHTTKILLDGEEIYKEHMELTGNFSWTINSMMARCFSGSVIGDSMVCTGGMTTGRNKNFVRKIDNNEIEETCDFEFFNDPITLKRELDRARLNRLSDSKQEKIKRLEASGVTRRNVRITDKEPVKVQLPHPDYRYYNKASKGIFYEDPKFVIYWKDDGDAVYTFKKNGNWYLHGAGGKPFFGREGITWSLISTTIKMRYLPEGYILDNGTPCGFLRPGVKSDELFFILGWGNTKFATSILKQFINHTKNIQGKDIERLPYPSWVDSDSKQKAIEIVKGLVEEARNGIIEKTRPELDELEGLYEDKNE